MKTKLTSLIILLFCAAFLSSCSEEDVEIDDHPIDQEEYNVYSGLFDTVEGEDSKVIVRSLPLRFSFLPLDSTSASDYGMLIDYPQFRDLFTESYFETIKDSVIMENRFSGRSSNISVVEISELVEFFDREDVSRDNCQEKFEEQFNTEGYFIVSRVLFDENRSHAMFEMMYIKCGVFYGYYIVMEKKNDIWEEGVIKVIYTS